MLEKGSIIHVTIARKLGFGPEHFGIYDGSLGVYHFTGNTPEDATIQYSSLKDFENGGTVCIQNVSDKKFDPDEIIERAMSKLGSNFGGYNLLKNNCEHFCYWCVTGIRKSAQTGNTNEDDHKRDIVEKTIDTIAAPLSHVAQCIDKACGLETTVDSSTGKTKDPVERLIDKTFDPLIEFGDKLDRLFKK